MPDCNSDTLRARSFPLKINTTTQITTFSPHIKICRIPYYENSMSIIKARNLLPYASFLN